MHLHHANILLPILIIHGLVLEAVPFAEATVLSDRDGFHSLRPVRRNPQLSRRRADLRPVHSAELAYADGDGQQSPAFFSTVRFQSNKPVLVLEQMEDLFADIQCSYQEITIVFRTPTAFHEARQIWSNLESAYVVASHANCSQDGERTTFQIRSIAFEGEYNAAILQTEKTTLRDAFHNLHLKFGHTNEVHPLAKQPQRLDRRQSSEETTPTPTSAPLDLTATSLIPSDTSTATATSLSINLTHGVQDTWFPDTVPGTDAQLPIKIGCKECSTDGTLTLAQGEWSILSPFDWDGAGDLTDIISAGNVQLDIEGFVAHVEIQIEPSLKGDMSLTLFTIPVFGFTIPELGSGGILVEPTLSLGWELSGGIEMSYGFELKIPNLAVDLDFANPTSSNVTGLDGISITDVPFQANISDIDLSLSLSLTPRITLGVEILGGLSAEVGTSLDLPKATVAITQLATDAVNASCANSSEAPAYQADFEHLFHSLTHVAMGVELGVGFDMSAEVDLLPHLDFSSSWELATVPVAALPTRCLAFQTDAPSGPGFTPAASAFAKVQAQALASASSASSASAAAASATATKQGGSGGSSGQGGQGGSANSAANAASGRMDAWLNSPMERLCFYAFLVVAGLFINL
ncbi:uncharacterized protein PV07_07283 [Cladophialophora immunda]|uniref:Gpi anchored protein n=1 Tax=Cladophialophora immunda TaxID=569365 RepID=A0A0D2CAW8_9EURO|nr:uncharacterized protein PV07_07283 [Cladophialophora immunda]KIW27555.1 hypothetical protein PV07_07283 [Cladophialophora immunda]OQU97420.1 hypothetical protein CLAIMM_03352 [Cladophialophora immunda]